MVLTQLTIANPHMIYFPSISFGHNLSNSEKLLKKKKPKTPSSIEVVSNSAILKQ